MDEKTIVKFEVTATNYIIEIKGTPAAILAAIDSIICEAAKQFNAKSPTEIKPSGIAKMIYCNLLQEEQKEQINKLEDF